MGGGDCADEDGARDDADYALLLEQLNEEAEIHEARGA